MLRLVGMLAMALGLMLGGLGCGSGLGTDCRGERSICGGGSFCCTETRCGGGMCTFGCSSDRDCPSGGYCSGALCFVACGSDRDCPSHLRCRSRDLRLMCRGD